MLVVVLPGNVFHDIGEPWHHAAADGTAGDAHAVGVVPLIGVLLVALGGNSGAEPIKAPDHEQQAVHHLNAKVAAWIEHGGHGVPGVGDRVVRFHALEPAVPIKPSNL